MGARNTAFEGGGGLLCIAVCSLLGPIHNHQHREFEPNKETENT